MRAARRRWPTAHTHTPSETGTDFAHRPVGGRRQAPSARRVYRQSEGACHYTEQARELDPRSISRIGDVDAMHGASLDSIGSDSKGYRGAVPRSKLRSAVADRAAEHSYLGLVVTRAWNEAHSSSFHRRVLRIAGVVGVGGLHRPSLGCKGENGCPDEHPRGDAGGIPRRPRWRSS